jgi:hypothetical protein
MLKWLATEIEVRSKAGTVDALISMTCVARSAKTVKTEPIWPYPNLRRHGYREDREGVRPGNLSSDGWAAREYGGFCTRRRPTGPVTPEGGAGLGHGLNADSPAP